MTTLSTHVLDTAHGGPAQGVPVALSRGGTILFEGMTDTDGRCPALRDMTLETGAYEIAFTVAGYFRGRGVALADPPFLDRIVLAFGIGAHGHYHVPLLVSPFGYSTYRGS